LSASAKFNSLKYITQLKKDQSLMKISKVILFVILLKNFTCFAAATNSNDNISITDNQKIAADQCLDIPDKQILIGGWYLWQPYQFTQITSEGYKLTGMDVELGRALAARLGIEIKLDTVDWKQHQIDLQDGVRDVASGATYSPERSQYAYFSLPYRSEENSLFVNMNSTKNLNFRNVTEYLAQIRLQNFRLGVMSGFRYGDPLINDFIQDPSNKDIILKYSNDTFSLEALMRGEIDGFMADKVVGASIIIDKSVESKVVEVPLNVKTPIHFIFSKKTVPLDLVDHFNQEIKKFVGSKEYKTILKAYVYPVLLLQTINSKWFYIIGVIGTLAFAVSGIAIAARENTTLFGTFILAMLPSVGGGIMRDVMINRDAVSFILNPSYMYYIMIIVLVGFATVRLLNYYNSAAQEDVLVQRIWDNLLVTCDALGQAAFIVTGVTIVIMAKIQPVLLWGPFFAFLTSNGGGILRDLIRKERHVTCLSDNGINAEISVLWGLIFSVFLDFNAYNPDAENIKYAVIVVASGAFITRMLVYYFNVPNLKFR